MDTEAFRLAENERSVVLIAGPTASGKSALALSLAERHDGVVLNADSMQVYDGLRIITARPSNEDLARAPHRLYGHVDPRVAYSVGQWCLAVAAEIDAARAAGRLAIIVGGTGLYFKALTEGLSQIPPVPHAIRERWRERAAHSSPEALHEELSQRDPEIAERLPPSDGQRILRALEVLEATGRSLAAWQGARSTPLVDPAKARRLVLAPPRDLLRARIETRFHQMMAGGALNEVAAFLARDLDPALPAMKAIGVAPLARHLAGDWDLPAATERAIIESQQYAKRQMTWFRGQMKDWEWLA